MKKNILFAALALLILVPFFFALADFNETTTFTYPGGELTVVVADNFFEHQKGLSGTQLDTFEADGMLFTFDEQLERVFWMKGMNYPLDIVWIRDGKIMKIETDVQPPARGAEPVRMYSRPFEVDMVLEVPAGTVVRTGMIEGHLIQIAE